jgi:hypothetical protein
MVVANREWSLGSHCSYSWHLKLGTGPVWEDLFAEAWQQGKLGKERDWKGEHTLRPAQLPSSDSLGFYQKV